MTEGLIVDLFAGGGGASTGIESALGRPVDIAINHNPMALAVHAVNHPGTRHLTTDVWEVDPLVATGGRDVELLWASPDCRHFSRAKGGKPVKKKIRSLAWVVTRWAKAVRPLQIFVENVPEIETWGPLLADGTPCARRSLLSCFFFASSSSICCCSGLIVGRGGASFSPRLQCALNSAPQTAATIADLLTLGIPNSPT